MLNFLAAADTFRRFSLCTPPAFAGSACKNCWCEAARVLKATQRCEATPVPISAASTQGDGSPGVSGDGAEQRVCLRSLSGKWVVTQVQRGE